jgi:hypothetical protein
LRNHAFTREADQRCLEISRTERFDPARSSDDFDEAGWREEARYPVRHHIVYILIEAGEGFRERPLGVELRRNEGGCPRVESGMWINGKEIRQETSGMAGCQGSTGGDVVSRIRSSPGGQDLQIRGKDVDARTIIGEVGTFITIRGRADRDSFLGTSR